MFQIFTLSTSSGRRILLRWTS